MSDAELQALVKSIQELREANAELRESQRESQRETDRAIRRLEGVFSSQWGALVEALVEPSLVRQFQERGIPVSQSARRVEGIDKKGKQIEIDVLLVDGDVVVAIEVKSKCKVEDVEDYEETLSRFREAFHQYSECRVLAGVAALKFESHCDKYAYKRGMYVLKPVEGMAQILNDRDFRPKEF